MQVLFIGGIFADCHNSEIISKTRSYVEYAANNFQRKILEGLDFNGIQADVISAPFIGSFPFAYDDIIFRGFDKKVIDTSCYKYVHFNNIWGLRNISRMKAVKHELSNFINIEDDEKLILVYTPHTPFIEAACYAKKRDNRIKICLIIPDLPQYMNLADSVSPLYKTIKKWDVKRFLSFSKNADTFVILTDHMKHPLMIGERPYAVVEGIYEPFDTSKKKNGNSNITKIVYTGKLDRSFGILNLITAFSRINENDVRLIICGNGEEKKQVEEAASKDHRIEYKGQVSSLEARQYIIDGDILINPRQNNTDYTKYSFPSKLIDYLSTGNTVIAYKLDGIPKVYDDFVYFIPNDSIEALVKTIKNVMQKPEAEKKIRSERALQYLKSTLSKETVGKLILRLNGLNI